MGNRKKIGVSSCLLGQRTRYDGGHRRDALVTGTLAKLFDFIAVCPEVECGLPVPREAMQLTGNADSPRLVAVQTRIDLTGRIQSWAAKRLLELEAEGLCGFIFKSGSPNCGLELVKVCGADGVGQTTGTGLFARAFIRHFPLLPVAEEGWLRDLELRSSFIERALAL